MSLLILSSRRYHGRKLATWLWIPSEPSLPTRIQIQRSGLPVNTEVPQVKKFIARHWLLTLPEFSLGWIRARKIERWNCPLENLGLNVERREKEWERTNTYRCAVEQTEYFTWTSAWAQHILTSKGSSFPATSLSRRTARVDVADNVRMLTPVFLVLLRLRIFFKRAFALVLYVLFVIRMRSNQFSINCIFFNNNKWWLMMYVVLL